MQMVVVKDERTALGQKIELRQVTGVEFDSEGKDIPLYEVCVADKPLRFGDKTQVDEPTAVNKYRHEIERAKRRITIREQVEKRGIPQERIEEWWNRTTDCPLSVLDKYEIPTTEQIEEWSKLPKDLSTLQKIRHPLLCGWTFEEILDAAAPHIGKLTAKYSTWRTPEDDCEQLGRVGIMKAVACDAGIAPFGKHYFLRMRTEIRRESATSQQIKETEKRPSKNEVRLLISAWLSGDILTYEQDRLAQNEQNKIMYALTRRSFHYDDYQDVEFWIKLARTILEGKKIDIREVRTKEAARRREQKLLWTCCRECSGTGKVKTDTTTQCTTCAGTGISANHVRFKKLDDVLSLPKLPHNVLLALQKAVAETEKLRSGQTTVRNNKKYGPIPFTAKLKVAEMKAKNLLNETDFTRKADWIECTVQKTGRGTSCRRSMIRNGFRIDLLTMDQQTKLFNFLNFKLNPKINDAEIEVVGVRRSTPIRTYHNCKHLIPEINREQLRTVGDLINKIATSPDFHSKPVALSVPMEDGEEVERVSNDNYRGGGRLGTDEGSVFCDPAETAEITDRQTATRTLINSVLPKLVLTSAQRMVLQRLYGLDWAEQCTGAFVAKFFGELVALHAVREELMKATSNHGSYKAEDVEAVIDDVMSLVPRDLDDKTFKNEAVTRIRKLRDDARRPQAVNQYIERAVEMIRAADLKDISRQRVTQYEGTTHEKIIHELFDQMFLKREDSRDYLILTKQSAKLTTLEDEILSWLYGLYGGRQYQIDEVVKDLDCITDLAADMKEPARREFLKEQLLTIKRKMILVHLPI